MSVQENAVFNAVERNEQTIWQHSSRPIWIVHYDAVEGISLAHYTVYRSVTPPPKGREPWSVDNRRQGDFSTLEAAMTAAGALA